MRAAARTRAAGLALALGLGLAPAACGGSGPPPQEHLTILVAFGGTELAAFQHVISDFESRYRISVSVETTRGLSQQLDGDLSDGDPPDAAALPSIGAIRQYADQGDLKPIDGLVDTAAYGPPWAGLMRAGPGGHVWAVPIKADVKSLIWYDPAAFRRSGYRAPATWSQLAALSRSIEERGGSPWCLAVSSTPTSGWPGTDWIADIMLAAFGPRTYQDWVSGRLPWTSGPVRQAWQMWDQLIGARDAVYGGRDAALVRTIGKVHPSVSGCYLAHGTLVDQGYPAARNGKPLLRFGASYGFFPFPAAGPSSSGTAGSGTAPPDGGHSGPAASGAGPPRPIQVSADFLGLFSHAPAARKLIRYLASTAAQRKWASIPGADGFSADSQVPVAAYPDPATRQIAGLLTSGQRELCFGASDAMSPDLETAFDRAILVYLADPAELTTTVLPELARVPADAGNTPAVCGTPPGPPNRRGLSSSS